MAESLAERAEAAKAALSAAWPAIMGNRTRALLSSLGVLFGTASVVVMVGIGKGAEEALLEQYRQIGVNNIQIKPKQEPPRMSDEEEENSGKSAGPKRYSPGLNITDAESIKKIVPGVSQVVALMRMNTRVSVPGKGFDGFANGVTPGYTELANLSVEEGKDFTPAHFETAQPVCLIGAGARKKLFANEPAVGEWVKCKTSWFKVVGVLRSSASEGQNALFQNPDQEVLVPVKTALVKLANRGQVTKAAIERAQNQNGGGMMRRQQTAPKKQPQQHQLDQVFVQMADASQLEPASTVLNRMLLRRHNGQEDFEIVVPQLLLKQKERTQKMFSSILAAIAGISLLVGGIGIMNIMLASVLERTREIGLRISLGARPADVAMQFLVEATLISLGGGLFGLILGWGLSTAISKSLDIPVSISGYAALAAFGISVGVGLIFGYYPARTASKQDPITSLRYE